MQCFCRSSRTVSVRVILLDDTEFLHEIQFDSSGQTLLDIVFSRLNIIETSYFGLRFLDQEGQRQWLESSKKLSRQLHSNEADELFDFYFGVKFYAVDPCKLQEEITRHQFYLQLKQDVKQGRLPVSFDLAALLGAFELQAEFGDYRSELDDNYVADFRLVNNQTKEMEFRIKDLHKKLRGIDPNKAKLNYLERTKYLDLYGVDLHSVLGENGVDFFLGLAPTGIIVLRNKSTVAHYFWPRISKVYFKGKYFMLRVNNKNNEVSTYGFETPKKSACIHLYKCCVEHYKFYQYLRVASSKQPSPIHDSYLDTKLRTGSKERNSTPKRFLDEHTDVQQPTKEIESPYRSTCSIPTNVNNNTSSSRRSYRQSSVLDSPRSTRSAQWVRCQQRGLFGITASPKSVRSASSRRETSNHRHRSSSVESCSSSESRSRRSRHRSKRLSDNESELSRGSGRSQNSHRKHRRHRNRSRDSSSENGSSMNYNFHDRYFAIPELVDSGKQWLEVQKKQKSNMSNIQQAAVVKNDLVSKSQNSMNRTKKHRKHRSPIDGRNKVWSTELAKHLQFELVDTTGMTENQLKDIPYTVIDANPTRRKSKTNSLKVHKGSNSKDRVDRIRGIHHLDNMSSDSSIKEFDRNDELLQMMPNLSLNDVTGGTNLRRIDSGIYSSVSVSSRDQQQHPQQTAPVHKKIIDNIANDTHIQFLNYDAGGVGNFGLHTNPKIYPSQNHRIEQYTLDNSFYVNRIPNSNMIHSQSVYKYNEKDYHRANSMQFKSNIDLQKKSSSLELILTPIIQSRRMQLK